MNSWYEITAESIFKDEKYRNIPYNPSVIKRVINMLLGNGLWIQNSSTRISINRKVSKSNKSDWVAIRYGIFQINIYQLDDDWFKVEVIEPISRERRVRFYICDQEWGLENFLKHIKVI
jgi:hypothetical protein